MIIETTVEIEGIEYHAIIDFDYTPADPGRFYGPPKLCYPAEPEEWEINEFAVMVDGKCHSILNLALDDKRLMDHAIDIAKEWRKDAEENGYV